ncbi:MAG: hypothetical protein E7360_01845 [Clostridiales bacterium]|nr:hypothetical protein [Clostridiales bacterium]
MHTEDQKKVIENRQNNVLLLASAGSGKTYTVANKIAEEIKSGIAPEDILCLTFTVKGAEELKDDVKKYCGEGGVNIFTIHGFCFYLIKEYYKNSGALKEPHIADEVDAGELLYKMLVRYAEEGDYELIDGLPVLNERQLGKIITAVKHRRDELGYSYSSEEGYKIAVNRLFEESSSFNSLFSVRKQGVKVTDYSLIKLLKTKGDKFLLDYQRLLRASNLMDFDDLIFSAKELLNSDFYKKYAYKLIIVDEMQDTSMLEYDIAESFFSGARVVLCGDPYQTIYSWRGSSPFEIIKKFKTERKAITVTLKGNRRSSPLLTYAGNYYLAQTFEGLPYPSEDLKGEKIDVVKCYDSRDEAGYIFDFVSEYKEDRSSLCIMARSNRYLADLYKYLEQINASLDVDKRIPFFTADSDFQFYKKPVIKDFLCFLRLLVNPEDGQAFSRITEKYVKGVGEGLISSINDFGAYGLSLGSFLSLDAYRYGDSAFTLMSAYKSKNAVIYDLETTGLDLKKDEMIQISAYKIGTGETFNRFVIPKIPITEKALLTHGYDLDYIKSHGGKTAKEVLEDFAHFVKGSVLIGHNSCSFDDFILNRQAQEEGVRLEDLGRYDTLSLCATVLQNLPNYKLSTCAEFFGIVNERAHDAFADVITTAKVLERLIEDYYIPMTEGRKRIIEAKKHKFEGFYNDLIQMKEILLSKNALELIKIIDLKYGILTKNNRKADRESANDLYRALKIIEESQSPILTLRDFLNDVALSGSQMDIVIKKYKKIPLITVHQSKGCEFETVILVGAGENEIPSYGARQSGSEEEEKRIFYVALSRAKKKFIMTYPSKKAFGANVYDRLPTPYLKRLPKSVLCEKSTY